MSYGLTTCPNCGGEVKVLEGHGGICFGCNAWVSSPSRVKNDESNGNR